jgi:hypothetical protein
VKDDSRIAWSNNNTHVDDALEVDSQTEEVDSHTEEVDSHTLTTPLRFSATLVYAGAKAEEINSVKLSDRFVSHFYTKTTRSVQAVLKTS